SSSGSSGSSGRRGQRGSTSAGGGGKRWARRQFSWPSTASAASSDSPNPLPKIHMATPNSPYSCSGSAARPATAGLVDSAKASAPLQRKGWLLGQVSAMRQISSHRTTVVLPKNNQ